MKRFTVDGKVIERNVYVTKCYECNMPLLSQTEWHPYAACEEFRRTSDSQAVERLLQRTEPKPWL